MTAARSQATAALLLATAAGCVDAVSYLTLHKTFTANMTGNTTELGIGGGLGQGGVAVPLGVAVAVFVVAIALGTAVIEIATRRRMRATATPALLLEAVLLVAFMAVGRAVVHEGATPDHGVGGFYVLLTIAILGMGIQTATLTQALGRTVRTTFVSGLLTMVAQEFVNLVAPPPGRRSSFLRDELGLRASSDSVGRLGFHACLWLMFVGGAVWGAFAERRWSTWALGLALGAVFAAAAVDVWRPVHATAYGKCRDHDA